MKISQAQEDRLLEYIDGTLNAVESEEIVQALKNSSALQARFNELNSLDTTLRVSKIDQPSASFTQNIMSRIQASPYNTSAISLRTGILLLIGILVIVSIGSVLVSSGVFDGTSSIDLNDTIQNKYIPESLPTITFNGKLIVNIIILVNLAFAFIILDRAILKPWFSRRSKLQY